MKRWLFKHTNPRDSKAEIRNSSAPIRDWKTGSAVWSFCNAVVCDVYVSILRIFCKSDADSIVRPSSAFAMICKIEDNPC